MRTALVVAAGLLAYGAWRLRDDAPEADGAPAEASGAGWAGGVVDGAVSTVQRALGLWAAPVKYAGAIAQAERVNGIPPRMLERLLWQESRWREDIVSGRKRSPVGAIGIAQAMPATAAEWKFDPLDAFASIAFAGRYLAWLRTRHGSWSEALAAYNWGTGNVQRKGLTLAPRETRDYYSQILADVNAATGSTYV